MRQRIGGLREHWKVVGILPNSDHPNTHLEWLYLTNPKFTLRDPKCFLHISIAEGNASNSKTHVVIKCPKANYYYYPNDTERSGGFSNPNTPPEFRKLMINAWNNYKAILPEYPYYQLNE